MLVPPALHAIYKEDHPFVVVRKPSQVGATEFNLNTAAWAAYCGYAGRGVVLYLLPTQEMADRISQARMSKVIQESPYLRRRAVPPPGIARGPANVQRRSIGSGVIYFCGSEQEAQYGGIDADVVILDEFDLMKDEVLSLAQARLRSSRSPRLRVSSTPTISDFGVSGLYELSDQRHYELPCPCCGVSQEPTFPESVDWDTFMVVCLQCRARLDPWQALPRGPPGGGLARPVHSPGPRRRLVPSARRGQGAEDAHLGRDLAALSREEVCTPPARAGDRSRRLLPTPSGTRANDGVGQLGSTRGRV